MKIGNLKTASQLNKRILEFITADEINDLARQGIAPHYKLTNPITKTEIYLFDREEIEKWVSSDLVTYAPSKFEPEITIYQYNNEYTVDQHPMPPKEIAALKNLMFIPSSVCKSPPGVYFLVKGDTVVYVGQSVSVANRITVHIAESTKSFDHAFFIVVPETHLFKVEQAFIKTLRPIYNQNNGPTREHHIEMANSLKLEGATL